MLQTELLALVARREPDAVAWRNLADGDALTAGQWHRRANRVARGLLRRGIHRGDRICLTVADDDPLDYLVAYMGIHRAAAVAVPINPRLRDAEVVSITAQARPAALIGSGAVLRERARPAAGVGVVSTVAELDDGDDSDLDVSVEPDDVADIMYTSGTTGLPKGVVVPHGGLATIDRAPERWYGLGFLTCSPFTTTSGSLLVCGPMRGGLSGWYLPRFDATAWMDAVAKERPVAAFVVPAMVQLLVAHPRFAEADLASLVSVNVGSAPIAAETLRRFGARLPHADVSCGYGMTEFGAVTSMPAGDRGAHLGSVGRPLPGVEVKILDPEGRELEPGRVGHIAIGGERRPRSYVGDPAASAATWRDGWLMSGDLGRVDGDGYLWIEGRLKDIIIRGGHNVVPGEVEAVLFEHPGVADAAVAGVPHDVLGEDVAAWVVRVEGHGVSASELAAFLGERLADYKVPRRITFVESLPRNAAGKVLKSQLPITRRPK